MLQAPGRVVPQQLGGTQGLEEQLERKLRLGRQKLQQGTVLFSLSSLAVSWDTFGCHGWGLLLTRDAAGRPTVLKAALHSGNTWPQTSVVPP